MEDSKNSAVYPTVTYSDSFVTQVSPEMSPQINDLATALSKAQIELESVSKAEKGYGYNYASLASTIEVAKPVLAKFGLAVIQLVGNEGDRPSVTTVLTHSSGQFIKSTASMPLIEMKGVNEAQRSGAVYSYIRRYALQAILNMSSEDNDASSKGFDKPAKKTSFVKKDVEVSTDKPKKFQRQKKTTEVKHDI